MALQRQENPKLSQGISAPEQAIEKAPEYARVRIPVGQSIQVKI
jgi:hypothetical protein